MRIFHKIIHLRFLILDTKEGTSSNDISKLEEKKKGSNCLSSDSGK